MEPGKPEADRSVLEDLQTVDWSNEDSVDYEVALDTISRLVAWYAARIEQERAKAEPNTAAIDGWRAERARWVRERQELRPTAVGRVREATAEAAELLEQLRASDAG